MAVLVAFAQRVEDLPPERQVSTAPPATTIGPHHIGETLDEWVAAAPACRRNTVDIGMDKPPDCDAVSRVNSNRSGYIRYADHHGIYYWFFTDRALSGVNVSPWGPDGIQVELGFLIQKYGTPTKNEVVTHQNLYGAKWEGVNAFWQMPDGTLITAGDARNEEGRLQLVIDFKSAATVEKELRERRDKPNPY
jgi:hypothetical protein